MFNTTALLSNFVTRHIGIANEDDLVVTAKAVNQITRIHLLTASTFYRILGRLSKIDIPANVGDFRLMSRRAVEALKKLREKERQSMKTPVIVMLRGESGVKDGMVDEGNK